MKVSKTLTNGELTEEVLESLEDVVEGVCWDVVCSIDSQLRKGKAFLDEGQKDKLKTHLRDGVNLNLTINAGMLISKLSDIDIYPRDINQRGLESFGSPEETEAVYLETTPKELSDTVEMLRDPREADQPDALEKRRAAYAESQA